jgi:NitT/TauT family transport system permease protein
VRQPVDTASSPSVVSGNQVTSEGAALPSRIGNVTSSRPRLRAHLLTVSSIALALAGWSVLSLSNPRLVPSIVQTFHRGVQLVQNGALGDDIVASVWRVLSGFLIGSLLGIAVGYLIGWYRIVHGLVDPWIQFLRMIPPLGLLPVVVIYLGIGESAKVSVIAFSVFLVVVIAAVEGARSTSPVLYKAARAIGATDWQLFQTVILPGSLPYILVGLRLGLAGGWTTVVAAELIAASAGLGYLVQISGTEFDLASAYVALLCIGTIGLAMDLALRELERRLTPWQERVRR